MCPAGSSVWMNGLQFATLRKAMQTSGILAQMCCCEQGELVNRSLGQAGINKNRSWVTLS